MRERKRTKQMRKRREESRAVISLYLLVSLYWAALHRIASCRVRSPSRRSRRRRAARRVLPLRPRRPFRWRRDSGAESIAEGSRAVRSEVRRGRTAGRRATERSTRSRAPASPAARTRSTATTTATAAWRAPTGWPPSLCTPPLPPRPPPEEAPAARAARPERSLAS